jgi:hypothetical protein
VITSGPLGGCNTYDAPSMKRVTGWVIAAAIEQCFDQPARRGSH